jgi:hypothetical protein
MQAILIYRFVSLQQLPLQLLQVLRQEQLGQTY